MNRAASILLLLVLWLGSSCGSGIVQTNVSSVLFDPSSATVSGGVCSSTATILDISGSTVSLLSATAFFSDSLGRRAEFEYDVEALAAILDSLIVPGAGRVTGTFSFDLGAQGLTTPSEGTIVVVGSGIGIVVTQFVGTLRCE